MNTKYLAILPLIALAGGCATVPRDMVGFFNAAACPKGWTASPGNWNGRYVVMTGEGNGQLVGEALSPGENRATGDHNHGGQAMTLTASIDNYSGGADSGHSHRAAGDGSAKPARAGDTVKPGTNAPYVTLRGCTKL